MSHERRWGRHRGRFTCSDSVVLQLNGDISATEAKSISQWYNELLEEKADYRFVVDVRTLGEIGSDARAEFASPRLPVLADGRFVEVGLIGATLRAKVLLSLVLAAAQLAANVRLRTLYLASWPDAMEWAKESLVE